MSAASAPAPDPHAALRALCRIWNQNRDVDPSTKEPIKFGSQRYREWYDNATKLGFISWTEQQKINEDLKAINRYFELMGCNCCCNCGRKQQ